MLHNKMHEKYIPYFTDLCMLMMQKINVQWNLYFKIVHLRNNNFV